MHHKINVKVYSKAPDSKLFYVCNSVVWSPEAMPKTLLIEINKRNVCASLQKSLQTVVVLLFHEWNTSKEVKLTVALEVSVYPYTYLSAEYKWSKCVTFCWFCFALVINESTKYTVKSLAVTAQMNEVAHGPLVLTLTDYMSICFNPCILHVYDPCVFF